ncbi:THAP-type domain-containing protein [Aphis craccivora]|uniref:THAP-type domain-containing protein n=1 Tax=Aphis craccivora TaxID=307492 RepID=A0A6G0YRH9_APHCR|nr:THAP-type domain-containing protein [Aphis craccivora]
MIVIFVNHSLRTKLMTRRKLINNSILNSDEIKQHIYHRDPLDNHRTQLMKLIIEHYISLILNHIARMYSIQMTGKNDRRNLTKF